MCLEYLDPNIEAPDIGIGYKFFVRVAPDQYTSLFFKYGPCQTDTWYEDPRTISLRTEKIPQEYPTGYHIFLSYKDAQRCASTFNVFNNEDICILKVQYESVVARGYNWIDSDGSVGPCIVARRMKILKETADVS